jgi:hypothetical protein
MTTEVDEHSKVAIIGKSDLAHGVLGSSKGALASGVFGSNSYHPPIRRDEVGILAPPKDDPGHEVGLLAPPKGYPGSGVLGVHSGDSGGSGVRGDSSAGYGVHGSSEAPNHSGVLGIHELRKGRQSNILAMACSVSKSGMYAEPEFAERARQATESLE